MRRFEPHHTGREGDLVDFCAVDRSIYMGKKRVLNRKKAQKSVQSNNFLGGLAQNAAR